MKNDNMANLKTSRKTQHHGFPAFFIGLTIFLPVASTIADEATRYVAEDDCLVYSGPDESLYATTQLSKGTMVEVYRETKNGWSGIRPPVGSFDWVAADAGHLLPGGKTLQIVGRPSPAWIGTYESVEHDDLKWQIELKPSQTVAVIGEAIQALDSRKSRTWFKIQPPQGEFRWIRSEKLVTNPLPTGNSTNNRSSIVVQNGSIDDNEMEYLDENVVVQAAAMQIRKVRSANSLPSREKTVSQSTTSIANANDTQVEPPPVDELPTPVKPLPLDAPESRNGPSRSLLHEDDSSSTGEIVSGGIYLGEVQDGESIAEAYNDGDLMEDPIVNDEMVNGEVLLEDDSFACGTYECREGRDCLPQTDSFSQWDALQNSTNPKLKVHPLGRILGLIGLSVSEAEIIHPEPSCTSCGPGTPTMAYGASPPSPSPRFGERFQHLPRPGRRLRAAINDTWMATSQGRLGSTNIATDINIASSAGVNPLDGDVASRDWHSPAMARMEPPLSSTTIVPLVDNSLSNNPSRFGTSDISLVSNEDLDSLQFSTPEVQQAMLELSGIVSRPMEQWSLTDLTNQAKNWIQNANDTIARGEARLLLDRIEGFEGLRQRSLGLQGINSAGSLTSSLAGSAPISYADFQRSTTGDGTGSSSLSNTPSENIANRNLDGTPASDASGWLVEVFSQQPGSPEFALTDDAGGLIAFVIPAPGMNLRRYIKQPVGIYGVKSYLPNLVARQITAERVVRVR